MTKWWVSIGLFLGCLSYALAGLATDESPAGPWLYGVALGLLLAGVASLGLTSPTAWGLVSLGSGIAALAALGFVVVLAQDSDWLFVFPSILFLAAPAGLTAFSYVAWRGGPLPPRTFVAISLLCGAASGVYYSVLEASLGITQYQLADWLSAVGFALAAWGIRGLRRLPRASALAAAPA